MNKANDTFISNESSSDANYFFTLFDISFRMDIQRAASKIRPAPTRDRSSAFKRFQMDNALWAIFNENSNRLPLSSVNATWNIYVKMTIDLVIIPIRTAFPFASANWSKVIATRPFAPSQSVYGSSFYSRAC